mmetsp:Transcript_52276/g.93146  ORF Transcript_52276/g.93146 Transcript_52276/m.93146 type:complete len:232 (+) Transcript_52276:202-897(+)
MPLEALLTLALLHRRPGFAVRQAPLPGPSACAPPRCAVFAFCSAKLRVWKTEPGLPRTEGSSHFGSLHKATACGSRTVGSSRANSPSMERRRPFTPKTSVKTSSAEVSRHRLVVFTAARAALGSAELPSRGVAVVRPANTVPNQSLWGSGVQPCSMKEPRSGENRRGGGLGVTGFSRMTGLSISSYILKPLSCGDCHCAGGEALGPLMPADFLQGGGGAPLGPRSISSGRR